MMFPLINLPNPLDGVPMFLLSETRIDLGITVWHKME